MKKKLIAGLIDVAVWTLGTAMCAVGVNVFATPNNIVQGGFTGLGIIFNYLWDLPTGLAILLLNIPLFFVAFKKFGISFITKTVAVTVLMSILIDLSSGLLPIYNGDTLLAALFCGVLVGGGLSLIFLRGATSGGIDILAKLLRLRWSHLSMGKVILAFDMVVVILSAIVFKSLESALYTLIAIYTSTRVIDFVMYGAGNGKLLLTVTLKPTDIAENVTKQLHRGVTILPVKGGYTGEEKNMIICAVRSSEVARLNSIIREIDGNAFTIITEAGEILGEGFGNQKK